jgi:putative ABC transport system permease protein
MPFFRALPHSLRTLLRAPAFSAVVIVVLALGIAANTTIFALIDEILLNPFPYPKPQELVALWESNPSLGGISAKRVHVAWSNFEAWRARNRSFQSMEAIQANGSGNLTGFQSPERLSVAQATPGFFRMLGMNASVGRTFLPGDEMPGANRIVLLSYTFARTHFAKGVPLGQSLMLDDVPYTVVGVLPKQFHLPAVYQGLAEYKPDVWIPLPAVSANDASGAAKWRRLVVWARLKPGTSLARATDDMAAIAESRTREDSELNRGYGVSVFSLQEENTDPDLRNYLRVYSLAALLVLLLACTSVAGLMFFRAMARTRSTAIMAALGANRWALLVPGLCESLVLACASGIAALLASYAGVHLIAVLKPSQIHGPDRLAVNLHAFVYTGCISMLTVPLFGLIPAWLATRGDLSGILKSSRTGAGGIESRGSARSVLLSLQIAVCLTLAIAATLLVRSFREILALDPGFGAQQVLTGYLALPAQRYAGLEDRKRFCRTLRQRLLSLPGVEATAIVDNMPLYDISYTRLEVEGRPILGRNEAPSADYANVTPDFFRAMGMTLRQGRLFTDQDAETNPANVVIVNESLARRLWPNGDAVGSHIRELRFGGLPPAPWQTVIGVVGDFRQFNPETDTRPELIWPSKEFTNMRVVVRTGGMNPLGLVSSLQQAVWSVDRDQPISDIQPLEQMIDDDNSQRKFNTLLLSTFAGASIILVLVGMYGLVSAFISSRTRDIGIRLALGAQRRRICLSLLRPALRPVVSGVVLGFLLSFVAKRLVATILFNVSPMDLSTYLVTPAALIGLLIVTSLAATVRVARIDPAQILRRE